MAERLSPGVFIEEVGGQQVVQAVSTSTMGIVGFTAKGPVNTPVLVTSFAEFQRRFGTYVKNARVPLSVLGFFSNGGSRMYAVRAVPADATSSDAKIRSTKTDQQIETGDAGNTGYLITPAGSLIVDTDVFTLSDGVNPTVTFQFDSDGSVVQTGTLRAVNFTTAMTANQVRDAMISAINDGGYTMSVVASALSSATGVVKLTHDTSSGIITTTETVANAGFKRATFVKGTTDTALMARSGAMPLVSSTMSLKWRYAGTAVVTQNLKLRDRTTNATGDASTANWDLSIIGTSLPLYDAALDSLVPASLTLAWTTARALIRCVAGSQLADTDVFTVDEGTNPTVTFQFDSDGSVVQTGTLRAVNYTVGMTADQVRDAIISAINDTGYTMGITASANGSAQVALTLDSGITAPIALTETVANAGFTINNPGARTLPVTSTASGSVVQTGDDFTTLTLDQRGGRLSVKFSAAEVPSAAAINASYTPASSTQTATEVTNAISGNASGSIVLTSGAYDMLMTPVPHKSARVLSTYTFNAWDLDPVSAGSWGSNIRVDVKGNADYYTAATGAYTRFDVNILERESAASSFVIRESYEELSFTDSNSASYFPTVVDETSDYVNFTVSGSLLAPTGAGPQPVEQLSGLVRSMVLGGGNEAAANKVFSDTLPHTTILTRSVVISYIDTSSIARTILDNGSGVLTGDVDSSATNTVNYSTGSVLFTTLYALKGGTLLTVSYATTYAETLHSEQFGDASKGYTAGSDGSLTDANQYGALQLTSPTLSAGQTGIYALNRVDDLMQVTVPDAAGNIQMTKDILDYVDSRALQPSGADRFAILTTDSGLNAQAAVNWFRFDLNRYSKHAALYWPWIKVADPLNNNRPLLFPSVGHVAGIYARTDVTRNVAKAPAGTVDGQLSFIADMELLTSQGDRDTVYPNKINIIRSDSQVGTAVWGSRTISNDSSWSEIHVRRSFNFIESSIYVNTAWICFEPNGPSLWARIKAQLSSFMMGLFNSGILGGSAPSDAFSVVCDDTNNTDESIASGTVNIDVAARIDPSAQFVVFRISQKSI